MAIVRTVRVRRGKRSDMSVGELIDFLRRIGVRVLDSPEKYPGELIHRLWLSRKDKVYMFYSPRYEELDIVLGPELDIDQWSVIRIAKKVFGKPNVNSYNPWIISVHHAYPVRVKNFIMDVWRLISHRPVVMYLW